MTVHELSASLRPAGTKGDAHKARRAGQIPAVVYGREEQPVAVALDQTQFKSFLKRHNYTTSLIRLNVDGAADLSKKVVMIRELQLHFIEREPLSVGFKIIDMSKPVSVTVPIIYEGEAKGVKLGAIVQHLLREIEVNSLPDRIPTALHCNIVEMVSGTTYFARELVLSEGVTLAIDADTPIVTCMKPREEKPVVAAGEEAAAAPVAAAGAKPAAAGAKPAAGAAAAKPAAKPAGGAKPSK